MNKQELTTFFSNLTTIRKNGLSWMQIFSIILCKTKEFSACIQSWIKTTIDYIFREVQSLTHYYLRLRFGQTPSYETIFDFDEFVYMVQRFSSKKFQERLDSRIKIFVENHTEYYCIKN